MELFMMFVFGLIAQFVVVVSARRMDRQLPVAKRFKRAFLPEQFRRLFISSDKKTKQEFLLVGIILQLLAYLLILVSVGFFLVSLFTTDLYWDRVSAVISLGLIVIGVLIAISGAFVYLFEEKKTDDPVSNKK